MSNILAVQYQSAFNVPLFPVHDNQVEVSMVMENLNSSLTEIEFTEVEVIRNIKMSVNFAVDPHGIPVFTRQFTRLEFQLSIDASLEFMQRSVVQQPESLTPLGIIGPQLKTPLKAHI